MNDIMVAVNYKHEVEAIYFNGELYIDNYGQPFELFAEIVEDLTRNEPARVSAPWHIKNEYIEDIIEDGFPKKFSDLLDKLDKR
jgi:hypothetical protein